MKIKREIFVILTLLAYSCGNIMNDSIGKGGGDYNEIEQTGKPEGNFVINNDDIYTDSLNVRLDIEVEGADEMRFSNDGINWNEWEEYSAAKYWQLETGLDERAVYGEFRNSRGDVLRTNDNIEPLLNKRINASDGSREDFFGQCVDISDDGNTIVVGADKDDDYYKDQGSIYVYKWNGISWEETKIKASDRNLDDKFGNSVSISGDGNTIVTGAQDCDYGSNSNQGAVYIYTWDGNRWNEEKVTAYDGDKGDRFGCCVSVSKNGERFIAGAEWDNIGTEEPYAIGSAYLFIRDGSIWIQKKFISYDYENGNGLDFYGNSVAISSDGKTFVIGAIFDDRGTDDIIGSAYVYKWDGNEWIAKKITSSDGEDQDYFGCSVSVSSDGNTIAIGAMGDKIGLFNCQGSVYVYEWDGNEWKEKKITAPDGLCYDYFGRYVALSEDANMIAAGAYNDNGYKDDKGAAYVFKYNGSNWMGRKINALDGKNDDRFGHSISIAAESNKIVFGACGADYEPTSINQGAIYILDRDIEF